MQDDRATDALQRLQGDILEAVARGLALPVIADVLCRRVEELAPGVVCSILAVEDGRLRPLAGESLPAAYSRALDGQRIGPQVGSCGTAAHRGEAVLVTDIAHDPLWADYRDLGLPPELRACWSSPIKARDGRVVGTFAFYFRESRPPSALEMHIVDRCVDLCAIAIEHEAAQARAHRLAFHDPVTGLPNRSGFHDEAGRRLAALRAGESVNVAYIDLDDFKAVNDSFGHRIGDQLLGQVAARLAGGLRGDAFVARLGGDTFAVIQASSDDPADARLLAGTIRAVLDEPFDVDQQPVAIGASVGIAHGRAGELEPGELERRADMALYEARAPATAATASTTRPWTWPCSRAAACARTCVPRSRTAPSRSPTSPSSRSPTSTSSPPRRSCAGSTRGAATCRPAC
jgi:diguanylate cyclase (GGDEF)-like protein